MIPSRGGSVFSLHGAAKSTRTEEPQNTQPQRHASPIHTFLPLTPEHRAEGARRPKRREPRKTQAKRPQGTEAKGAQGR